MLYMYMVTNRAGEHGQVGVLYLRGLSARDGKMSGQGVNVVLKICSRCRGTRFFGRSTLLSFQCAHQSIILPAVEKLHKP